MLSVQLSSLINQMSSGSANVVLFSSFQGLIGVCVVIERLQNVQKTVVGFCFAHSDVLTIQMSLASRETHFSPKSWLRKEKVENA